jgi:integrase
LKASLIFSTACFRVQWPHTAATTMIRDGEDIVVVAEILGHSTGKRVHRQPAHRADHAPKPGSVAEFSEH